MVTRKTPQEYFNLDSGSGVIVTGHMILTGIALVLMGIITIIAIVIRRD